MGRGIIGLGGLLIVDEGMRNERIGVGDDERLWSLDGMELESVHIVKLRHMEWIWILSMVCTGGDFLVRMYDRCTVMTEHVKV